MKRVKWMAAVVTSLVSVGMLVGGCSAAPTEQVVKGTAAVVSFPNGVDTVQAVRAGQVVTSAKLGADGAFSLRIPSGTGYRIEFVKSATPVGLVFPRAAGSVDVHFSVSAGGPAFDLGAVRYVGASSEKAFTFMNGNEPDGECEDGIDANTGAVCVDDDEEGECDPAEEGGVDCVDGIDSATGQECDGGPEANQDGGDEGDAGPTDQAVADHNLPATLGCDGEEDDD